MFVAGDQLGRYTIHGVLGAGGMGTVYRAHDARLQRAVAIKLIDSAPGPDSMRRILREARAASALNHPGICTVHDVVEDGERVFIVMELVEGQPLAALVPPGDFPSLERFNMPATSLMRWRLPTPAGLCTVT